MTANIYMTGTNSGLQVAHNCGQISQNIFPPERAQTPTEPLSTVPFSRNPEFVDRGSLMADTTLLSDIHEKCSAPDARLALVGMGGVGKSQMVIEYCYRTRVTSPGTWVFWVHASNAFRFEQGYREIAEQARIPRCRDSDADLMRSVVNWLRDLKRKWILVLDNLDDNRFLNEPRYSEGGEVDAKMPPVGYLPHSANGSIIITTRDRRVALDLVDDNCIVQIDPMTQPEAVSLLDRMLGDQGKEPNRADVLKLAETLEYMPLAIEQAAAYIRRQFPLYSIQQYIRDFERSDDERLRLLAHEAGRHYRDWEAKNSILVTWQLSFNQIRAENPSAAALLSLMSFFDRQAIPEALLHIQSTEHDQNDMHDTSISTLNKGGIWVEVRTPIRGRVRQVLHDRFNWLRPSFWTAGARSRDHQIPKPAEVRIPLRNTLPENTTKSRENALRDDILILRDYSLLSICPDHTLFEMHGLVQLATRNWLKFNGEFDKWLEDFMCRLENAITQDNYEQQGWAACRLLLPHVESARLQRPSSDALVIQWGILLYRTACYLSEGEVPGVLLPLLLASKQAFEQCLGPENKLTIYSAIHVAFTHVRLGRYVAAETAIKEIIGEAERLERMENYYVTVAMIHLISVYKEQGRLQDAELQALKAIELQRQIAGPESRNEFLATMHLVDIYLLKGQFQEAEMLGQQLVEATKLRYPEDTGTFSAIGVLATAHLYLVGLSKAEELCRDAVAGTARIFGQEHRETIRHMVRLGDIYRLQGRLTEAEHLLTYLLPISIRTFGPRHPESLSVIESIGHTSLDQGRRQDCEIIMKVLLQVRQDVFGLENYKAFEAMEALAYLLQEQGQLLEAETLAKACFQTRKKDLGSEHFKTLRSMIFLASIWKAQGKVADATDLFFECIKIRRHVRLGRFDTHFTEELLESWVSESGMVDAPLGK